MLNGKVCLPWIFWTDQLSLYIFPSLTHWSMLTCYKLPHYFPSNPWHFKVLFILWWKTEVIAWISFVIFWPVLILIKFLSLKVISTCILEIWALLLPQSLLLESHSAERNWKWNLQVYNYVKCFAEWLMWEGKDQKGENGFTASKMWRRLCSLLRSVNMTRFLLNLPMR